MFACLCVCVCACVRACVRACVCMCLCYFHLLPFYACAAALKKGLSNHIRTCLVLFYEINVLFNRLRALRLDPAFAGYRFGIRKVTIQPELYRNTDATRVSVGFQF